MIAPLSSRRCGSRLASVSLALALALIIPLPHSASASTGSWSIQPTPRPSGASFSTLADVSCWSPTGCIAVGHGTARDGAAIGIAQRWNGIRWSIEPIARPAGADGALLFGVSCSSGTACTAVGSTSERSGGGTPLIERWSGARWRIEHAAIPAHLTRGSLSYLAAVSCPSRTSCTAVGHSGNRAGTRGATLAEQWDGARWTIQRTPAPAGAKVSFLAGVSCPRRGACGASGSLITRSGVGLTLAERWNGTRWSIERTPTPAAATGAQLAGISCAAPATCVAVGLFDIVTGMEIMLAERHRDAHWSIEKARYPSGATGVQFNAVSCRSASTCTAVGSFGDETTLSRPLVERRTAAGWSVDPTPSPPGAISASLSGVSCVGPSVCTAVGGFVNAGGTGRPLAERGG